jgi:hypothetical protein
MVDRCSGYFLGPSTLLSTIFRASAKASAGVAHGIVAASLSPSSSYIVTMKAGDVPRFVELRAASVVG